MTATLVEDIAVPPQAAASAARVLPLKELSSRGKEWTLTLHAEHLALADSAEGRPFVILRDQMMKTAVLAEPVGALVLTQPLKLTFKLPAETAAALAEWIGKPALARHHLKQRYGLMLPVAALCMLGSLPLSGNPAAGVQPIPFNPLSLTLGILLAVSWAFAKWHPRPLLFLTDSIWFTATAAQLIASVVNGRSKGLLVLLPFLLWMVVRGIQHFRRFRGTTMAPSA
jgi:hypothetical protein